MNERTNLKCLLLNDCKNIDLSKYRNILHPQQLFFSIKGSLYKNLCIYSKQCNVTINTILQFVWHKALSVYGNCSQTTIGVVVSGRNIPVKGVENCIGLLINTLPVKIDHSKMRDGKVTLILQQFQQEMNNISMHSAVDLVSLQIEDKVSFDSLFIVENGAKVFSQEILNSCGIEFKCFVEKIDYPLALVITPGSNKIMMKIRYAGELFDKEILDKFFSTVKNILEQLASLHSRSEMFSFRLKDLKYISLEQYDQLVNKKSDDELQNPNLIKKTFSNLFTEQVYKTPDNMCVVCKDRELTYADLDRKSNNLMMYIKSLNIINSNNLIVLFLDKNEYVMISILGVMKAGGAYVPIDVEYPDSRICYILKDTKAELILANKRHEKRLNRMLGKDSKINIIFVDDNTVGKKSNEKNFNSFTRFIKIYKSSICNIHIWFYW